MIPTQKQFSLTRAALSTCGCAKSKFLSVSVKSKFLSVDGAEALNRFQEARTTGKPFAAVILDLTVPGGMGGREAVQRLRALDPSVKAIVSSGYSEDPIMAMYREHGFSGMVAKPYRVQDFSRTVKEVVQGSWTAHG